MNKIEQENNFFTKNKLKFMSCKAECYYMLKNIDVLTHKNFF